VGTQLKGFSHLEVDDMYEANKPDELSLKLMLVKELLEEFLETRA